MSFQDDWFKETPGTLAWQWKQDQREAQQRMRDQTKELQRRSREAGRQKKARQATRREQVPQATAPAVASDRRGGGSGFAVLGAVIGVFLAAGAGASVLGGLLLGAIAGVLFKPALRLLGALTVVTLKLALAVGLILVVLGAIGALFGG